MRSGASEPRRASPTVLLYWLSNTARLFRSNPSSGVPVYLQLIEQVKHATTLVAFASVMARSTPCKASTCAWSAG